ncbi:hypothetical protein V495_06772 [Pseudogymnoascus sp. VKM F-4514 (FW-929)]|nr:hypothetical protein V495_06772 [Pseudogymnoascus sp. VKM F-4514 (FW-929)]KFY62684.1 hypothetical protein V497_02274 [Pseudogymnoascus sp. VKM F-4516 (FW-969)]
MSAAQKDANPQSQRMSIHRPRDASCWSTGIPTKHNDTVLNVHSVQYAYATGTPPHPELTYAGIPIQDEARVVLGVWRSPPSCGLVSPTPESEGFSPTPMGWAGTMKVAASECPCSSCLEATNATLKKLLRLGQMGVGWSESTGTTRKWVRKRETPGGWEKWRRDWGVTGMYCGCWWVHQTGLGYGREEMETETSAYRGGDTHRVVWGTASLTAFLFLLTLGDLYPILLRPSMHSTCTDHSHLLHIASHPSRPPSPPPSPRLHTTTTLILAIIFSRVDDDWPCPQRERHEERGAKSIGRVTTPNCLADP